MSLVQFPGSSVGRPDTDRARTAIELMPSYIELAAKIAKTEFVPTGLRNRPEAVLAALLSGAERGLGPMESLRSISIIEGRPNLSAEAMRALVLAAGHEIEIVESTAQRATVVGRRAGSDSTSPPFTWTIDRARRARLDRKDNWQRYPEAMLLARASTDLCRAVFPDVIAGLAATEEVLDELALTEAQATATPTRRRRPSAAVSPAVPAGELAAPIHPPDPVTPEGGERGPVVDAGADPATVAGVDDDDTTPWAPTATETPPADPALGRRIHAQIADTFPNAERTTHDRIRHALVAVVTRRRPDGPITSSSDLDHTEQLALSNLLERIRGGQVTLADGPDATIELHGPEGYLAEVILEPGHVAVSVTQAPAGADPTGDPDPTLDLDETGDE